MLATWIERWYMRIDDVVVGVIIEVLDTDVTLPIRRIDGAS